MAGKKRGLGRNLDALLGNTVRKTATAEAEEPVAAPAAGDQLAKLPVDLIQRGKYQPRDNMRTESLQDLADSIRAQGVVQPIVVRPIAENRYEIIAGERRWRAAQLAGLETIPAVVRDVDDQAAIAMALIENIQRENLSPLEEAQALARLIQEFDMTHQQAGQAVGRSRAAVSNLLRLLELHDAVKTMIDRRELEMGHARSILSLPLEQQRDIARQVAEKGLSVRETERLVRATLQPAKASDTPTKVDPNIRHLENDLAEKLGAKVSIQHDKGKGKLVIQYSSLDELDGILVRIQ